MNARQAKFVREYLKDFKGAQAAIRAGYAVNSARQTAHDLLTLPDIARAVEKGKDDDEKRAGLTRERVLIEVRELAHSCVTNYQVDEGGNVTLAPGAPPDAMQAVSSIKRRITTYGEGENARTQVDVEIKLWDKPGAIKLAGKHLDVHGFTDRLELTGKDGETLGCTFTIQSNGNSDSDA
jgi:phage terminase small subunit